MNTLSPVALMPGDGMFGRIKVEQTMQVTMKNRTGGDHLGVEQRMGGQQPMKEPAVSIGPLHHRRNTQAIRVGPSHLQLGRAHEQSAG